ncbi:MAG: hypothetical protein FGM23_06665 [Alphaproteobacteria bacterium]|nr:hypothetical protein [Alphaproteobacteria bacterium]
MVRVLELIPYILAFGGEIKTHSRFEPANALYINIMPNYDANNSVFASFKNVRKCASLKFTGCKMAGRGLMLASWLRAVKRRLGQRYRPPPPKISS